MRLRVRSLALLSGLRIRCCRELWCRLQTRLGSGMAVAVHTAAAPIQLLAWELPYAAGVALKTNKQKKKKEKKRNVVDFGFGVLCLFPFYFVIFPTIVKYYFYNQIK